MKGAGVPPAVAVMSYDETVEAGNGFSKRMPTSG